MPMDEKKLGRLIEAGYRKLQLTRKSRYRFLQQFTGRFYGMKRGEMEEMKASPINLMWNAVTTWVPNHVAQHPKYKTRTNVLPFRPYSRKLELALNFLVEHQINLRLGLRKAVTNALFGMSVFKVGLASTDQCLYVDGGSYVVGRPYADPVDQDDIVFDPLARDWEELYMVGNRFRITKEAVLALGIFPEGKIAGLQSRYDRATPDEVSLLSDSKNATADAAQILEYVDLVEVYLPHDKLIVTMPWTAYGPPDKILRIVEYEGPDTGPYKRLAFAEVPDNVMGVAPAGIWYDLHMMANKIARKIGRQADRSKVLLAYEGSAVDDAIDIADGDDGESIRVDNVDAMKELNFGGVTDDSYKYMEWCQTQFSTMANNLDQLSGARDDSDTATQAQMLNANASVRLNDTQSLVYEFTREIGRDLAYFLHTDPLIDLPLTDRVGGVDVQVMYSPEMRQGKWMDYMISVQPYSLQRLDPNLKMKRKMDFATQVLPAAVQAFVACQQVGIPFNIMGFLTDIAREVGIEEADEYFPIMSQQIMQSLPQLGVPNKVMGATAQQMAPQMAQAGMIRPPQRGLPALGGGARPQQPNPGQMARTGGTSDAMERRQYQQAGGAAMQQAYPQGAY